MRPLGQVQGHQRVWLHLLQLTARAHRLMPAPTGWCWRAHGLVLGDGCTAASPRAAVRLAHARWRARVCRNHDARGC